MNQKTEMPQITDLERKETKKPTWKVLGPSGHRGRRQASSEKSAAQQAHKAAPGHYSQPGFHADRGLEGTHRSSPDGGSGADNMVPPRSSTNTVTRQANIKQAALHVQSWRLPARPVARPQQGFESYRGPGCEGPSNRGKWKFSQAPGLPRSCKWSSSKVSIADPQAPVCGWDQGSKTGAGWWGHQGRTQGKDCLDCLDSGKLPHCPSRSSHAHPGGNPAH